MLTHNRLQNASSAWLLLCMVRLSAMTTIQHPVSHETSYPVQVGEIETVEAVATLAGRAIGTSYTLKFVNRDLKDSVDDIAASIRGELERIESIFSLYRSGSELSRLNSAPAGTWIPVSEDLYTVAKFAVDLSQLTDGAFDPTLRPLVELWQGDRLSGAWIPPSQEAIDAKLRMLGTSQLMFQPDSHSIQKLSSQVELDLNSVVEGWVIERILDLLKRQGCTNALFELGGEYGAVGSKPEVNGWTVGIEDPQALSQIYATVCLKDVALCTSGSYRQARQYAGKRYSHIIDPRTGSPVSYELLSVSVLHPSPMLADGWATALMVLGPVIGLEMAEKHGLAASFVCQSINATSSPMLSASASGKILPKATTVRTDSRVWLLAYSGIIACSSLAAAWFVFRKRRSRFHRTYS